MSDQATLGRVVDKTYSTLHLIGGFDADSETPGKADLCVAGGAIVRGTLLANGGITFLGTTNITRKSSFVLGTQVINIPVGAKYIRITMWGGGGGGGGAITGSGSIGGGGGSSIGVVGYIHPIEQGITTMSVTVGGEGDGGEVGLPGGSGENSSVCIGDFEIIAYGGGGGGGGNLDAIGGGGGGGGGTGGKGSVGVNASGGGGFGAGGIVSVDFPLKGPVGGDGGNEGGNGGNEGGVQFAVLTGGGGGGAGFGGFGSTSATGFISQTFATTIGGAGAGGIGGLGGRGGTTIIPDGLPATTNSGAGGGGANGTNGSAGGGGQGGSGFVLIEFFGGTFSSII